MEKIIHRNLTPFVSILSVYEDIKPLCRIECQDDKLLKSCVPLVEKLKLKSEIYVVKEREKKSYRGFEYLLYVSKTEDNIKKGIYYHHEHSRIKGPRKEDENAELGKLYGYPECCIKKFIKNVNKFEWDLNKIILETFKNSKSRILPIYTNRVSTRSVIPVHMPHSFECRPSIEIGKRKLGVVKKYFDEHIYQKAIDMLECCVIIFDGKMFNVKNFELKNDGVVIKQEHLKSSHKVIVTSQHSKEKDALVKKLSPFLKNGFYNVKFENDERIEIFVFADNSTKHVKAP